MLKINRLFILHILVLLLIFSSCESKEKNNTNNTSNSSKQLSVDAVIVEGQYLKTTFTTNGRLMPNEQVRLMPEIAGRVIEINFDEGAFVKKGNLLVKIDDRIYLAEKKKLEAQLALADKDLERNQNLFKSEAVSEEELDMSKNAVEILKAELEIVKTNIDRCNIRAPFDGIAGFREVSLGAFLSNSDVITTFSQIQPIKLEFEVPENLRKYINANDTVNFEIHGSDELYQAKIYAIDQITNEVNNTFRIRALKPNLKTTLSPGNFTSVNIILKESENAILIPTDAVKPSMTKKEVYVVRNGKAVAQEIKTGDRREKLIEITAGINIGDTILTTGLLQVRDSMQVEVNIKKINS